MIRTWILVSAATVAFGQMPGIPYSICYPEIDDLDHSRATDLCQTTPDCRDMQDDDDLLKLTYGCFMRCDDLEETVEPYDCLKFDMKCLKDVSCVVLPPMLMMDPDPEGPSFP